MSGFYDLGRFIHPSLLCSAKSEVTLDSGVVHAELTDVSMAGFCIITSQKITFDGMFDGVFVVDDENSTIRFKACCVDVEKLKKAHVLGQYKTSFCFLNIDSDSKKSLSAFIQSSIKGYLTVV